MEVSSLQYTVTLYHVQLQPCMPCQRWVVEPVADDAERRTSHPPPWRRTPALCQTPNCDDFYTTG
eukprot:2131098-Amphidinium_carterae.1